MIMSAIIIASSILTRSIQTTVLSLKNYNIANILKKLTLYGKCVIVVSHSELIKDYANEIIILKDGINIIMKGELSER